MKPETQWLMWSGKAIQHYRKSAEITVAELSRRSGVDRDNIDKIESGEHIPTLKTVACLASAMSVAAWRIVRRAEMCAPQPHVASETPIAIGTVLNSH